jgi:hypothetical protein
MKKKEKKDETNRLGGLFCSSCLGGGGFLDNGVGGCLCGSGGHFSSLFLNL